MATQAVVADYEVELPAGGTLHLQTPDEVQLWTTSRERYEEDYTFPKQNDLITLGQLLLQQIIIFRAQTAINGMEPELDQHDVPTGSYRRVDLDGADVAAWHKTLKEAANEMRALERALGIDKATREQGGAHTVDNYLKFVKRAANERGIHIAEMVVEYQRLFKELRWKLRMLYNADAEDRRYHNISPKSILDWLRDETEALEEKDKEWAKTVGKVFVGQL